MKVKQRLNVLPSTYIIRVRPVRLRKFMFQLLVDVLRNDITYRSKKFPKFIKLTLLSPTRIISSVAISFDFSCVILCDRYGIYIHGRIRQNHIIISHDSFAFRENFSSTFDCFLGICGAAYVQNCMLVPTLSDNKENAVSIVKFCHDTTSPRHSALYKVSALVSE